MSTPAARPVFDLAAMREGLAVIVQAGKDVAAARAAFVAKKVEAGKQTLAAKATIIAATPPEAKVAFWDVGQDIAIRKQPHLAAIAALEKEQKARLLAVAQQFSADDAVEADVAACADGGKQIAKWAVEAWKAEQA